MRLGIIPAYAGSTYFARYGYACNRDHPRIRGEHLVMAVDWDLAAGSSPHTRGAPFDVSVDLGVCGIIPAYAGSTAEADGARLEAEGSSPHTRGALLHHQQCRDRRGIIPAYAGSTRIDPRGPGCRRDHPRIRGEHPQDDDVRVYYYGSSPHTRGAL